MIPLTDDLRCHPNRPHQCDLGDILGAIRHSDCYVIAYPQSKNIPGVTRIIGRKERDIISKIALRNKKCMHDEIEDVRVWEGDETRHRPAKRVSFITLGCKVNQYDTQVMIEDFERHGYTVLDFPDEADIYVVNTCIVTGHSEAKCRQVINQARNKNPDAIVVVTGCYPQVKPKDVASIPGVTLAIGTGESANVREMVEGLSERRAGLIFSTSPGQRPPESLRKDPTERERIRASAPIRGLDETTVTGFRGRTRAFLKAQEGCERRCSYCVVPLARGRRRSKSPQSVLEELEALAKAGFREIVLTGTDLGAYGCDMKVGYQEGGGIHDQGIQAECSTAGADVACVMDLAGLLRFIGEEFRDYLQKGVRIRLSSVEPYGVTPELLEVMEFIPQICRHLHIPLQSGSDHILRLMGRGYTAGEFLDIVNHVREVFPDMGLTTDVIVGFPGETQADFEKTVGVVKEAAFSRLHVFRFSPRPGTAASTLLEQVGAGEKRVRSKALLRIGRQMASAFHESLVGTVQEVLVEDIRDKKSGLLQGLTSNYARVFFPGEDRLKRDLAAVRIVKSNDRGLIGRYEGCVQ